MKAQDVYHERRHTASTRDAATTRLRRVTRTSVAVAVAFGGFFAALAARSTHPKKTVARVHVRQARLLSAAAAPAPPLIAAAGDAAAGASSASPSQPVAAPAPASTPPVVVSGGS